MYLSLTITSKSKTSLNNFLYFISKLDAPIKIIKNIPRQNQKRFLSVLTSPHVNKDAQEQFEIRTFSKTLTIWSHQQQIFINILKWAIQTSFPGIVVKIHCLLGQKNQSNYLLKSLNPSNVFFNFFKDRKTKANVLSHKICSYIDLFESYGELTLEQDTKF